MTYRITNLEPADQVFLVDDGARWWIAAQNAEDAAAQYRKYVIEQGLFSEADLASEGPLDIRPLTAEELTRHYVRCENVVQVACPHCKGSGKMDARISMGEALKQWNASIDRGQYDFILASSEW